MWTDEETWPWAEWTWGTVGKDLHTFVDALGQTLMRTMHQWDPTAQSNQCSSCELQKHECFYKLGQQKHYVYPPKKGGGGYLKNPKGRQGQSLWHIRQDSRLLQSTAWNSKFAIGYLWDDFPVPNVSGPGVKRLAAISLHHLSLNSAQNSQTLHFLLPRRPWWGGGEGCVRTATSEHVGDSWGKQSWHQSNLMSWLPLWHS